jgi:hypothetical protein
MRRRRLVVLTLAAGVLATGVLCRPACLVLAAPASPAPMPCHAGGGDPVPDDDCCMQLTGLLRAGGADLTRLALRLPVVLPGIERAPDTRVTVANAAGGRYPPTPDGPPLFLRDRALRV